MVLRTVVAITGPDVMLLFQESHGQRLVLEYHSKVCR